MSFTLGFDDALAAQLPLSGGKGANLALLAQRGFPVPPGFVVTAPAYRAWLAGAGDLSSRVAALRFGDPAGLREDAARLREALARLPLPAGLAAEVGARLALHGAGAAFSVRSSSTMEDLAGAAFAGQHDTFLNCAGEDLVLSRVGDCFASLWQDRALAYRHRRGLDHLEAAMAVVVQRMVACEAAGVGFSVNPVSGRLDELVIDSAWGLGEAVVSGEGDVDHFVLDRSTGRVKEARVATKARRIASAPGGGTAEVEVPAERAAQPSLTDAQAEELARIVLRIEESYRFPQDVEWGLAEGRFSVLQARPVTAIPPRWTRDESAERFPNALTPLTWDFVEGGFHRSLAHSFALMGFPPCPGKWFALFHHHVYGNQNAVEAYGRYLSSPLGSLDDVRALVPALRERFRWVQDLPVQWSRNLDWYLMRLGELAAEPLDARTDAEVWRHVLAVNEHGAEYFLPNIAISVTHGALYRLLHGLLALAVGPSEAAPLFDALLAHCDTKTGLVNRELHELASLARGDAALGRLLASPATSRELWDAGRLRAHPAFAARLSAFLRDHGHREVDFDAHAPTWIEQPWIVLDNVRLVAAGPMDGDPAARERAAKVRMQQAELELYRRVPSDLHFFFGEIVRLARTYTALDDLEHYQTTRLTLPLRRGLRELGRRLRAKGVVGEDMDVFFARREQVGRALADASMTAWGELREAIARQREAYLADAARPVEWTLGEGADEAAPAAGAMAGIPGSPGAAEGPAFLVLSPDDFARFPRGAVLVARTTNPTWTPLFCNAVAVVTESGGPLSHGAVTAREMRIPAVMAVRGCLGRIANGQRLRVDGTRGIVEARPGDAG